MKKTKQNKTSKAIYEVIDTLLSNMRKRYNELKKELEYAKTKNLTNAEKITLGKIKELEEIYDYIRFSLPEKIIKIIGN